MTFLNFLSSKISVHFCHTDTDILSFLVICLSFHGLFKILICLIFTNIFVKNSLLKISYFQFVKKQNTYLEILILNTKLYRIESSNFKSIYSSCISRYTRVFEKMIKDQNWSWTKYIERQGILVRPNSIITFWNSKVAVPRRIITWFQVRNQGAIQTGKLN